MTKIQLAIRSILTIIILYYVYFETGPMTVISLFLLFAGVEIENYSRNAKILQLEKHDREYFNKLCKLANRGKQED